MGTMLVLLPVLASSLEGLYLAHNIPTTITLFSSARSQKMNFHLLFGTQIKLASCEDLSLVQRLETCTVSQGEQRCIKHQVLCVPEGSL